MIKNIIANYFGRFWSIFSNIVFIPLYIHFLGIEGYSIISFSLVLSGLMAILDAGLTATLSKEFASHDNSNETKQRIFTTLESIYIIIAATILTLFLLFSRSIADKWLNLGTVSSYETFQYLIIIGIGIAFQLLSQFYWGGLMGLERQVKANVYQVGLGVVRNGLVVVPLLFLPNLYCFFIWQTVSMIIYTIIVRRSVVKTIFNDKGKQLRLLTIEKTVIDKVWRFAGGIMLISLVAAINTQMDKLAISKFMPIENLGYYTLAVTLSQGLIIMISPIGSAIFPRLTALYSTNQIDKATDLFHKVFLTSNILIFAFAANMIFNGESLIWIWTNNMKLALAAAPFIPFLAAGVAIGSLQTIPYYIALANGYTKFNNYLGIISIIITFPGYWIMTRIYGSIGAAIVWCIMQTILTPIFIYLVGNKYLKQESISKLFFKKIFLPICSTILIAFLFSRFDYFNGNRWGMLAWIGLSTFITLIVTGFIFLDRSIILQFAKQKINLRKTQ